MEKIKERFRCLRTTTASIASSSGPVILSVHDDDADDDDTGPRCVVCVEILLVLSILL